MRFAKINPQEIKTPDFQRFNYSLVIFQDLHYFITCHVVNNNGNENKIYKGTHCK